MSPSTLVIPKPQGPLLGPTFAYYGTLTLFGGHRSHLVDVVAASDTAATHGHPIDIFGLSPFRSPLLRASNPNPQS